GTASAGVTQVTKIEAVNTNKLNVGGTTPLVGIGLAAGVTPTVGLEIESASNTGARTRITKTGQGTLQLSAYSDAIQYPFVGSETNHSFGVVTNNAERLTIASTGNVGVGVAPEKNLHVKSATAGGILLQADTTTADQYSELAFMPTTNDAGSSNLQIRGHRGSGYTSNYLTFHTAGGEAVRIDSAGLATFSSGIAVTTGGIKFPATQSASADANTLDDYEEGTWTAAIAGASSVTNTTGYYTRIGRLVHITYYSSEFTSTAVAAIISGLPFNAGAYQAFTSAHNTWTVSATTGYFSAAAATLTFTNPNSTGTAVAAAASARYVMVSGTYFV
ncbi:MAG: hypothetical protein HOF72_10605, partial [Planctomycetaceae bacterium]|nr:hypothetical protein [Planctomycetaceae bacterium]